LREYRTRLIADVVTGKLDVREVARRLPDDDDDNEPLDGADTSIEDEEMTGGDLDAIAMDGENG
jgi:type I restriction enzyme S subunit